MFWKPNARRQEAGSQVLLRESYRKGLPYKAEDRRDQADADGRDCYGHPGARHYPIDCRLRRAKIGHERRHDEGSGHESTGSETANRNGSQSKHHSEDDRGSDTHPRRKTEGYERGILSPALDINVVQKV